MAQRRTNFTLFIYRYSLCFDRKKEKRASQNDAL